MNIHVDLLNHAYRKHIVGVTTLLSTEGCVNVFICLSFYLRDCYYNEVRLERYKHNESLLTGVISECIENHFLLGEMCIYY